MRCVHRSFRGALCTLLLAMPAVSAVAQDDVAASAATDTSEAGSVASLVPTLWDLAVQGGGDAQVGRAGGPVHSRKVAKRSANARRSCARGLADGSGHKRQAAAVIAVAKKLQER